MTTLEEKRITAWYKKNVKLPELKKPQRELVLEKLVETLEGTPYTTCISCGQIDILPKSFTLTRDTVKMPSIISRPFTLAGVSEILFDITTGGLNICK